MRERKKQKADEYIGGRYAMSYDDFMKNINQFPADIYKEHVKEIGRMGLGAELIVAGFDQNKIPLICTVNTYESCEVQVVENFAVIGEGASLALASLLHREYSEMDTLPQALYKVYEAKMYSERVGSVGKKHNLVVHYFNGEMTFITESGEKILADCYKLWGPQQMKDISLNEEALIRI